MKMNAEYPKTCKCPNCGEELRNIIPRHETREIFSEDDVDKFWTYGEFWCDECNIDIYYRCSLVEVEEDENDR